MFDESSTRALLRPADPARDVEVPRPTTTAAELISMAEAVPRSTAPGRRRLLLAAAALVVAAGAVAGAAGFRSVTRDDPTPHGQAGPPAAPASEPAQLNLGPVVRPVALQYADDPPAAADRLRALAGAVAPAPHDSATGRYTYIRTVGWNAVLDDAPDGTAQAILPQDRELWYAADGSGRLRVRPLPAVYPNEQSRRYWQQRASAPPPSSGARVDDLPAGMAGPSRPLPTDPAQLATLLGADTVAQHGTASVFHAVRDLYSVRAPSRQVRAQVLRILADLPGISWRGEVTDRAGRAGVAISVETSAAQQVLVLDPGTGALLAWDSVERPVDTVAGATLFLGYDRTDHLR